MFKITGIPSWAPPPAQEKLDEWDMDESGEIVSGQRIKVVAQQPRIEFNNSDSRLYSRPEA